MSPRTEQSLRSLGVPPESESDPMPPVDLRTVPREQWEDYDCAPLVVPPDVARYLAGLDGPMTTLERDGIEDRVAAFYGITPPWLVTFAAEQFRLQRE